jgi:predicted DNA-binding protein (UPF0278 family)
MSHNADQYSQNLLLKEREHFADLENCAEDVLGDIEKYRRIATTKRNENRCLSFLKNNYVSFTSRLINRGRFDLTDVPVYAQAVQRLLAAKIFTLDPKTKSLGINKLGGRRRTHRRRRSTRRR